MVAKYFNPYTDFGLSHLDLEQYEQYKKSLVQYLEGRSPLTLLVIWQAIWNQSLG
jgi:hypothetical protein